MKRFLVFGWYAYDAGGGWNDLIGQADTLVEAQEVVISAAEHHFQIIDTTTAEDVS